MPTEISKRAPIAVAFDTNDLDTAQSWAKHMAQDVAIFKLGLEFFNFYGKSGINSVMSQGKDNLLFLDLKLHDIPNTVAGASKSIAELNPTYLTVHALGGGEMISAVSDALPNTRVTAVTVLTSLKQSDLSAMGIENEISDLATTLAISSVEYGARAIVCSPNEVSRLRACLPKDVHLITPGVRPAGEPNSDQSRVATPSEAISWGADFVVIGRPITRQWNPAQPELMLNRIREIADSC